MLAVSAGPLRLSGVFPPIMPRKSGMKRSLANSATKGVVIAPFDVLACPHSGAGVTHFTVTFGSATAMTYLLLRGRDQPGPYHDLSNPVRDAINRAPTKCCPRLGYSWCPPRRR